MTPRKVPMDSSFTRENAKKFRGRSRVLAAKMIWEMEAGSCSTGHVASA